MCYENVLQTDYYCCYYFEEALPKETLIEFRYRCDGYASGCTMPTGGQEDWGSNQDPFFRD